MEVSTSDSENGLTSRPGHDELLVVGLGASAGGIEALMEFFRNVRADSGMVYVVILHLLPEHDSKLAEVLQNVAPIPVTQVTQRVSVEPDHVYVVPPNQHLEMAPGYINVSPNTRVEEQRAPVDIFFRTLAESYQAHAVAVILSGTGANGSMGIKRIKERGGAAFVQNPREAEFNEMPRRAIATDLVDEVLPVAEIPGHILAYKQSQGLVEIPLEPNKRSEEQQQALREIFTQLRIRTGHDFSNYKRPTVLRRIERRVNVRRLPNLPAYAAYIAENPDEAPALLKDLLISVTNFFRDPKSFDVLERDILPRIMSGKSAENQVRVWVVGCATGEEAYSMAMLLAEKTLGVIDAPKVQIFATDIDEDAIAVAREGLYTLNDAADISPERLRRFFSKEGDSYRIRREIREMVLFAHHNVLKDPPFSHLDLVTCRNVLIYLNNTAQERVMETFHFALNPGGYLFLGTSESADGANDLYAIVSREYHIYQSRQAGARLYPTPEGSASFRFETMQARPIEPSHQQEKQALERISYGELHQQLLEQYAPPSIVVNETLDIVHLSERAGRYLQIAGGEPSSNLLKLIRPELRLELRTALYQAVQRNTNVDARNLQIRVGDRTENITIRVRPVLRQTDTARGFLLILFEQGEATEQAAETLFTSDEPVARQLEEELMRSKEQLRTVSEQYEAQTEELRASNEELQAMNEELRSAAEELETSKEELQSINEELRTVNQELKVKVEEAMHTSNNLQNLVNSTDIGTIFLDRSFHINLFTSAAREIFNLLPADFGRPLSDITSRLVDTDLIADAETVLEKLQVVEREVRTTDNRVFMMRVLPYRTAEDRINGVVVTFFDITERKAMERGLRESRERLASALEAARMAAWEWDSESVAPAFSGSMSEVFGLKPGASLSSQGLGFGLVHPDDVGQYRTQVEQARERGQGWHCEFRIIRPGDGEIAWLEERALTTRDSDTGKMRTTGLVWDVTERKRAAEALRESEEHLRLVLESVKDYAIITADDSGIVTGWNDGAVLMFGYTEEEAIGQNAGIIFTPEDREAGAPEVEMRAARETGRAADERWHIRKDGTQFWMSGVMFPLRVGETMSGYVKIARDLTEQRRAEAAISESEARFRILSDAVPQIIWTNDASGYASYFNSRWFDYSGLSLEDSLGLGWQKIVHPEDAPEAMERWRQSLSKAEIFDAECRLRRADGIYRWHILRNVPFYDDGNQIEGWFGSATDIEELKDAELALRQSGERLRVALESAEMGAWDWNVAADRVTWNERHFFLLGLTPDSEPKTSSFFLDFVHPEDRERVTAALLRALNETDAYQSEFRITRADNGEVRWMSGYGRAVGKENGRATRMTGVTFDSTERKRTEEELQQAHDELESRVRERTRELAQALEQVRAEARHRRKVEVERAELMKRLVTTQEEERGRISRELHDNLGQHLTAVMLGLQALENQVEALTGGQQHQTTPQIGKLRALVDGLMRAAHRQSKELRPAELDSMGVEAAVGQHIRDWSELTGVPVDYQPIGWGARRPEAIIETTLYRVVQEALTNVARHAAATQVGVVLELTENSASAIVEDNGRGFDTSANTGRLGLLGMQERLSIVNGTLSVESSPGNGTTIFARVPFAGG